MTDKFGIPDSMFGPVEDDFAGALGRIAMVGAFVESKLDVLVASIDHRPQSRFAGESIGRQLTTARKLLRASLPARPSMPSEQRENVIVLLDRVESVMWRRNEVLHAVWPRAALSAGFDWRHLPVNQRKNEIDWMEGYTTIVTRFTALLRDLVDAVGDLQSAAQDVEAHERVSIQSSRP